MFLPSTLPQVSDEARGASLCAARARSAVVRARRRRRRCSQPGRRRRHRIRRSPPPATAVARWPVRQGGDRLAKEHSRPPADAPPASDVGARGAAARRARGARRERRGLRPGRRHQPRPHVVRSAPCGEQPPSGLGRSALRQRQSKLRAATSLGQPRPIGSCALAGRPHPPCCFFTQGALLGGAGLGAALAEGARVGQRWGRVSAAFGGGRAAARWGGASERLSSVLAASAATLCDPGCNLVQPGLQPYVTRAATSCSPGCSPR